MAWEADEWEGSGLSLLEEEGLARGGGRWKGTQPVGERRWVAGVGGVGGGEGTFTGSSSSLARPSTH